MSVTFIIGKLILCAAVFIVALLVALYSTYGERKVAAWMQDRVGPDRAGKFGLLQPFADGVKMFMKEEIIPSVANKFLFILGPSLFMIVALMTSVVIPWGNTLIINGEPFSLQITDINIGVLYLFGVASLGVYGIMIGGWASNNKFSLLGAIRASAQMISYEIALGFSIVALVMVTGTISIKEIVEQQAGGDWNMWNIVYQPLGFLIFLICSLAECNRAPFDMAECETELVGGFHTEYSSMKLGLFLFAEYINMFISCSVLATFYFGGYNFPFMNDLGLSHNWITILGIVALFLKIFGFIYLFMWIRWTLPRFRYDQLMNLGWKILIPLSIVNIGITGLLILLKNKLL